MTAVYPHCAICAQRFIQRFPKAEFIHESLENPNRADSEFVGISKRGIEQKATKLTKEEKKMMNQP